MDAAHVLPGEGRHVAAIEGYADALQHLSLLREKREHLRALQREAETQHLKRAADAYYAGLISRDDLVLIFEEFKAVTDPGYTYTWNSLMPMRAAEVDNYRISQRYRRPNTPYGGWEGSYPFGKGTTPGVGTPVVYVLFDALNEPCYVGSTQNFRPRLHTHNAGGKEFAYWRAYPCENRESAYDLETRLLQEHKPYLNKRAHA